MTGILRHTAMWIAAALAATLCACTIEPPLKLAGQKDVEWRMPEVVTDLSVVWDVDADWRQGWWYGWDDRDVSMWGPLEYPQPKSYEVRFYYLGDSPDQPYRVFDATTVVGNSFRRRFDFGYHHMVFWSNIDSPDGKQSVIFDERDVTDINATTSRSRLNYTPPMAPPADVCHNPEIFYSTVMRNIPISQDTADYDYYDDERQVWVMHISAELQPMVYIYLVQYVIYNNRGRITGITDNGSVSALADGVSIHTGVTSNNDVVVSYPLRMKQDLPAREGRSADIIGGKLTTFGLCGMEPWSKSRATMYHGPRGDLRNRLMVPLTFSNSTDSVYTYDITPQMQRQAHGGVITIEVDADTITIPVRPGAGHAGGFDPWVQQPDSVVHKFDM